MDEEENELYRLAFLKASKLLKNRNERDKTQDEQQDGEGVQTRRQVAVDQPTNIVASKVLPASKKTHPKLPKPSKQPRPAQVAKPALSPRPETPSSPLENVNPTSNTLTPLFQKEEILFETNNIKIFIVKSDLKRMVNFKIEDHLFCLRAEANA